ncbi:hypothetical protein AO058_15740 [Salegentibacter sp. T436]|jgi:hypothetical protein|nr:hypothetical protein AO058_15740 [Salegentibacter sp. T436]
MLQNGVFILKFWDGNLRRLPVKTAFYLVAATALTAITGFARTSIVFAVYTITFCTVTIGAFTGIHNFKSLWFIR